MPRISPVRFWLKMLALHLMLIWCVLWNVQHVAKAARYGWFATMGLNGASMPLVVATVLTFGLWCFLQLILARLAVVGWHSWFREAGTRRDGSK